MKDDSFEDIFGFTDVFFGCGTRFFILRQESRLNAFYYRTVRCLSRSKTNNNGEWRGLDSEKFHSLNCSSKIAGNISIKGEVMSNFKMFTGKRFLGRPRTRWEDHIRMDLKEIGVHRRSWTDSAKDGDYWRDFLNVTLNLRVS